MMRHNARLWILALFLATTGCARQVFVSMSDYDNFNARNNIPKEVTENNAQLGLSPLTPVSKEPGTVDHPDREPRYISLQEAIALSLEHNSTTGIQSVRQPGNITDDLLTVGVEAGVPLIFQSDSVRVLTMHPAAAATFVERSLSRFDPKWVSGVTWSSNDQPIQGFNSFQNGDAARFDTSVVKALPSGGIAGLVFSLPYQMLSRPPQNFPIQNPAWTPRAGVTFEQPLLQGFGDINQLLGVHPGPGFGSSIPGQAAQALNGSLNQATGQAGGGILLARLRFDQSRAEFERAVNFKLLNIEVAYWNLYGAYVTLYSSEQALRQTHEIWKINKISVDVGAKAGDILARSLAQYQQLRADRLVTLGRVLEAERVLRTLIGLPAEDGQRLVPIDTPTTAPYQPSWEAAIHDALTLRPELIAARQELKAHQFDVITQKNFLKPDLRFVSGYFLDGLGTRLDGNGQIFDSSTGSFRTNNAFRSLSHAHYHDWQIGLNLNVPLGYRLENANVRRTMLRLAQAFLALKREEEKAERFLVKAYRDVIETYRAIERRREERKAYADELQIRSALIGEKTVPDFEHLRAVQGWTNALNAETQAIVAYNNALIMFEFAKGTIQQYDNVNIAEGPLPECAYVRAVEHQQKRTASLVLRQRSQPMPQPPGGAEPSTRPLHGAHMSPTPMLSTLVDAAATPSESRTFAPTGPLAAPASRDVLTNDIFRPARDNNP